MMEVVKGHKSGMIGRALGTLFCVALLSACGGGGGGGDGGSNNNPAPTVNKPAVNAGTDITVSMADRVDLDPKVLVANGTSANLSAQGLEISGSSENKEAIVKLVWSKIEGPDIAIASSGFNDGRINFIAPSTNGASSVKISFKLTLTNAAGLSAEDTITITVNRVNLAPVANAGDDFQVSSGDVINVTAASSRDTDGSIAKYQWSRVSGPEVVLEDAAAAQQSFVAPTVNEEVTLELELSIEDNEGKKATDRVKIKILPRDVPVVRLNFPPAKGIYTENTLSLFGYVSTASTDSLASLTVDTGNGPIAVNVDVNGAWRIDNVALPSGVTEISIKVEATDTTGRKGIARSQLFTSSATQIGTGQSWDDIVGIDIDSSTNKLWMISYTNADMKLLSIDLANGDRGATISDFNNTAQGISTLLPTQFTIDEGTGYIYLAAGAPKGTSTSGQILRINTVTGNRSLVSDNTRGTGVDLKLPWGMVVGGTTGELYVADNNSDSILRIDTNNGNRTVIADANTLQYGIDAPMWLAKDNRQFGNSLFISPYTDTPVVFELDLDVAPATTSLVINGFQAGSMLMGEVKGLAIDALNNTVFFNTFFNGLVGVNLLTGERREIVGATTSADALAFDDARGVIYLVDGFPEALYVVDPVSGHKVIMSKPNNF